MKITCGIDWAEAHHDVAVLDTGGQVVGRRKIDTGVTGFGELMSLPPSTPMTRGRCRSRSRPTRT